MSKEVMAEYSQLLLIRSVKRAKERPTTSLEKHISKLPSALLEALTKEVEYAIHHVFKPLLNTYDIEREYMSYLTRYYIISRSAIAIMFLGYIEKGEVPEFKKFVVDITETYYDFVRCLQNLENTLTKDEIDTLSFMFLSACEYNLGMADRMAKLPLEVFDFLKRVEVSQLVGYASALDCVLSSASLVSLGDIELNERVKENLKTLVRWGESWANEVFNMCIRVGISNGDNVLKALPEVRKEFHKELEESFRWWAREKLKIPTKAEG